LIKEAKALCDRYQYMPKVGHPVRAILDILEGKYVK